MIRLPVLLTSLALAAPAVAGDLASAYGPDAARVAAVMAPATVFTAPEPFEARPLGAATALGGAPGGLLPNLSPEARMQATLGEAIFEKLWVPAPTATRASDGLGPLYNARACAGCHEKGGRGRAAVLKLGRPGAEGDGAAPGIAGWHPVAPDPGLGRQLQDFAITGLAAEGQLAIDWQAVALPLSGGEVAQLRRPVPRVTPALDPATRTSLRMPPALYGLGLIEAIPEAAIRTGADPDDADGDGISGRVAEVPSAALGGVRLGRYGHKAGAATLADMVAGAFSTDMGLSSPLAPDPWGDCTAAQTACRALPSGEDAGLREGREVGGDALTAVADYVAALALPDRTDVAEPEVLAGKAAFAAAGCPACHRPKFVTARDAADPARSFQLIWPFSDFLLHDMGPELAAGLPEGVASGAEWRTAPLWGIGTTGRTRFLHDGRARSPLEAVLWHGGEAAAARARVVAMPPADRAALIRYLESL